MKVIIAGGRNIDSWNEFSQAIKDSEFDITEVIAGGARGVDAMAEKWAGLKNLPCTVIKADWDKLGKVAGPRRNETMAKIGEALIAIWDGESPGTQHMITIAKRRGLNVFIHRVKKEVKEVKQEKKEKR